MDTSRCNKTCGPDGWHVIGRSRQFEDKTALCIGCLWLCFCNEFHPFLIFIKLLQRRSCFQLPTHCLLLACCCGRLSPVDRQGIQQNMHYSHIAFWKSTFYVVFKVQKLAYIKLYQQTRQWHKRQNWLILATRRQDRLKMLALRGVDLQWSILDISRVGIIDKAIFICVIISELCWSAYWPWPWPFNLKTAQPVTRVLWICKTLRSAVRTAYVRDRHTERRTDRQTGIGVQSVTELPIG